MKHASQWCLLLGIDVAAYIAKEGRLSTSKILPFVILKHQRNIGNLFFRKVKYALTTF
jgi:hypothetical protein